MVKIGIVPMRKISDTGLHCTRCNQFTEHIPGVISVVCTRDLRLQRFIEKGNNDRLSLSSLDLSDWSRPALLEHTLDC